MVTLTIDNQQVSVPEGTTILKAAEKLGIKIPTLCFLEKINQIGACRVCVVQVDCYSADGTLAAVATYEIAYLNTR